MIKRTLHFGSPCKLALYQEQLQVSKWDEDDNEEVHTLPLEDVGVIILEEPRISITHAVLAKMLEKNIAVISCDGKHHPTGMLLNLNGHSTQAETFIAQANSSQPLKKQLWQQTVKSKIKNQGVLLDKLGVDGAYLKRIAQQVKSGDSDNREGVAAVHYWPKVFYRYPGFLRDRNEQFPNNLLNYGYSILRAIIARSLVGSGLHPTLGIFHRNRYNHYCLADDMMEPYRPVVDTMVADLVERIPEVLFELEKEHRVELLRIPTLDVRMNGKKRPLMVAASETSASLARCYLGEERKLALPELC